MSADFHLKVELKFERLIHQSRLLSIFRRNPSTWELLLQLASESDDGIVGVYDAVDRIETRYLGNSALLKFVRERRDDGLFRFRQHEKRSKWRITLEPHLRDELLACLAWRNAELRGGPASHSPDAAGLVGLPPLHEAPRTVRNAFD